MSVTILESVHLGSTKSELQRAKCIMPISLRHYSKERKLWKGMVVTELTNLEDYKH